jgi:hypothetical protein
MQFTTYIRGSLIRFNIIITQSPFDLKLDVVSIVPHVEDEALLNELCPRGHVFEVFDGYLTCFPE